MKCDITININILKCFLLNILAVPSKTGTVAATGQPKIGLSDDKLIGKNSRGTGIEFSEMPAKYRRRPISADEIEYIEVSLNKTSFSYNLVLSNLFCI